MKKALIVMSILLMANPLSSAVASKKPKKKSLQNTAATATVAPAAATTDDALDPDKSESETPPISMDNLSGNMTLTTNYMFRGISLSANNPAIQGGLTYTFPIGFYANIWGSNADYLAPDGKRTTSEFDTIVGYQGSVWEDFTYNLNLARYNYPGTQSANYNEFNSLFGYKIFQLGYSYSSNYSGTHAVGQYVNGVLTYDLPPCYVFNIQNLTVQAGMGHYSLAHNAGNSYSDYLFTLTKKFTDKYSLTGMWTATNGRAHLAPYDRNQFVGTLNAYF